MALWVQVLDDEICYKYTEFQNVYEVFATRARMFRSVYLHKCGLLLLLLILLSSC